MLPAGFWILAALALVSDFRPITGWDRRWGDRYVFGSTCFAFAILLVWGFGPALVVQAIANVGACARLRMRFAETVLVLLRHCAGLAAAGGVLLVTGEGPVRRAEGVDGSSVTPLVLAVAAALVASYGILVLAERTATSRPWRATLSRGLGLNLLASTSLLFLAPVIVAEPRGWTFALLLLPVLALSEIVRLVARQNESLRRDALTGVLSQRGINEAVDGMLGQDDYRSKPYEFALLLVQGSPIPDVSESFGRSVGDQIVVEAARRLRTSLRPVDTIGRLEGNEFVLLVPGVSTQDAAAEAARTAIAALDEPAIIHDVPFDIRGPVGVALAPEHGADFATLFRHADAAARDAARATSPHASTGVHRRPIPPGASPYSRTSVPHSTAGPAAGHSASSSNPRWTSPPATSSVSSPCCGGSTRCAAPWARGRSSTSPSPPL